jgi:transposase
MEPVMNEYITYVALDAHKKEHRVCLMLAGEEEVREFGVKNQVREMKRMVKRIQRQTQGPIRMCYEAGPCGFALQRQLVKEGVSCVVVAPSLIPVKPGDRVKTDRRDARKLLDLFRAGLLTEVHPPTDEEEAVRELCRCREAVKQAQTAARHQLSKFLLRHAMIYREGAQWTQKHFRWLRGLTFENALNRMVFTDYLEEVERRTERLKALDQALEEVAQQEPYSTRVGWLRCFRGIDTVTAMSIVAELFGFARFSSARGLMSYLGLTSSEDSSAGKRRQGAITKAGNSRVRRLLIEAAWHQRHWPVTSKALRKRRKGQPAWVIQTADRAKKRLHKRYWWLVGQGKLPKLAVTAVARELVGFLWSVLYTQIEVVSDEDAA